MRDGYPLPQPRLPLATADFTADCKCSHDGGSEKMDLVAASWSFRKFEAAPELTLTMRPRFASMRGRNASVTRLTPYKLVSRMPSGAVGAPG